MKTNATTAVPVAHRVGGFVYAIRNIVSEAQKVEAAGGKIRPMNIGDPAAFGFDPPLRLIEAVNHAMRDGHNVYTASPGILPAREAVAADFTARGVPMTPDRVVLTTGASEGIELALGALLNPGDEVLLPLPVYPFYTAVLAKLEARPMYYRTDPSRGWTVDVDHLRSLISSRTRALVMIDPNNPTGAVYLPAVRQALVELADRHNIVLLADEVYNELVYTGPVPPIAAIDPDAPIVSFWSLSKSYSVPGWRAGWLTVGTSPRMNDLLAAILKLADGRLCSNGPMQHAIAAAVSGDRSHLVALRAAYEQRAKVTADALNAIEGVRCVLPAAAFYAMPQVALPPGRTDEDYVLALLRETGVLCVHGSGFGMPASAGFLRIAFLASPTELSSIYADVAAFTRNYLQRG
jgi:alanine-synthesizing transaminase